MGATTRRWWLFGVWVLLVCLILLLVGALVMSYRSRTERAAAPAPGPPDWLSAARAHLEVNPYNPGLVHLVDATEGFNFILYVTHANGLDRVRERGWREADADLVAYVAEQGDLIESLVAFAHADGVDFPPFRDAGTPSFEARTHAAMNRIMRAEIERLRAADELDLALERTLDLLLFNARFRAAGQPLIQHLEGLKAMNSLRPVALTLLADERISEESLSAAAEALATVDEIQAPAVEAVRAEAAAGLRTLRTAPESLLGQAVEETALAEVIEETDRVLDLAIAELEKPIWEREVVDEIWLVSRTESELARTVLRTHGDNLGESGRREALVMAEIRLLRALCLDRLGREEEIASLVDPFSGEDLEMTKDWIFSVGPDGVSQVAKDLFEYEWDAPLGSLEGDMAVRRSQ
jgi:hypothetical protein